MGPIWGQQDPGGPHVGPMNFAIWVYLQSVEYAKSLCHYCPFASWGNGWVLGKQQAITWASDKKRLLQIWGLFQCENADLPV